MRLHVIVLAMGIPPRKSHEGLDGERGQLHAKTRVRDTFDAFHSQTSFTRIVQSVSKVTNSCLAGGNMSTMRSSAEILEQAARDGSIDM